MADLQRQIEALRPKFAAAANKILDAWQQDDEGWDEDFGEGGACDAIADAITDILYEIPGVTVVDGGQPGDDHAYRIVYDDRVAYAVDIPPNVYETGGGYHWRKRANVVVDPDDITIDPVRRSDVADRDEDSSMDGPATTTDNVFVPTVPPGAPVVVVLVEQDGCGACEEYHPTFVRVAQRYAAMGLPIVRIDANTEDAAAQAFMAGQGVDSTPTVIAATLYRGPVAKLEGVTTDIETRRLFDVAWAHNRR